MLEAVLAGAEETWLEAALVGVEDALLETGLEDTEETLLEIRLDEAEERLLLAEEADETWLEDEADAEALGAEVDALLETETTVAEDCMLLEVTDGTEVEAFEFEVELSGALVETELLDGEVVIMLLVKLDEGACLVLIGLMLDAEPLVALEMTEADA